MDQVFTAVGDAINNIVSNPYVQLAGRAVLVYLVFLWVACAYWAYRDLQSRTPNPIAPYLAAIVIILFTPVFFVFGLILYWIVRPREKVAEANERALAEEAMLREIEGTPHCANCGRRVEADWLVCPTCRNQLRGVCPSCAHKVELDWMLCAWCGHDLRLSSAPAVALPPATSLRPLAEPPSPAARRGQARASTGATSSTGDGGVAGSVAADTRQTSPASRSPTRAGSGSSPSGQTDL